MDVMTKSELKDVEEFLVLNWDNSGSTEDYMNFDHARRAAFAKMKPGATALVNYYYTVIEPDNGERNEPGTGNRPYGMTKTQRALEYLREWDGSYGTTFVEKYPNLLRNALERYEREPEVQLKWALDTTLADMTGEQFLLVLSEYDRRKAVPKSEALTQK